MVQQKERQQTQTAQPQTGVPSFLVTEIIEAKDGSSLVTMELDPMRYRNGDTQGRAGAQGAGLAHLWSNATGEIQFWGHLSFRIQDLAKAGVDLSPGTYVPIAQFCSLVDTLYQAAPAFTGRAQQKTA